MRYSRFPVLEQYCVQTRVIALQIQVHTRLELPCIEELTDEHFYTSTVQSQHTFLACRTRNHCSKTGLPRANRMTFDLALRWRRADCAALLRGHSAGRAVSPHRGAFTCGSTTPLLRRVCSLIQGQCGSINLGRQRSRHHLNNIHISYANRTFQPL